MLFVTADPLADMQCSDIMRRHLGFLTLKCLIAGGVGISGGVGIV